MKLDTKQQVLLALYIEYQKDLPDMARVTCTALNMDYEVFCVALSKLQTEGYIDGFKAVAAENERFYEIILSGVRLTRDGIEYVENNFGIQKELTAEDKLQYVIKKCGVFGLSALKTFGVEALKALGEIIR